MSPNIITGETVQKVFADTFVTLPRCLSD